MFILHPPGFLGFLEGGTKACLGSHKGAWNTPCTFLESLQSLLKSNWSRFSDWSISPETGVGCWLSICASLGGRLRYNNGGRNWAFVGCLKKWSPFQLMLENVSKDIFQNDNLRKQLKANQSYLSPLSIGLCVWLHICGACASVWRSRTLMMKVKVKKEANQRERESQSKCRKWKCLLTLSEFEFCRVESRRLKKPTGGRTGFLIDRKDFWDFNIMQTIRWMKTMICEVKCQIWRSTELWKKNNVCLIWQID